MSSSFHNLVQLGFSEKEAKVFESLVSGGRATVTELSERSGVNRTTTYIVVEALKEKGVVVELAKDRNSLYVPVTSEQFIRIFNNKLKDAEKSFELSQTLSELLDKYGTPQKFGIEFFEGEAEIRVVYEQVVASRCEVRRILNPINLTEEQWLNFLVCEKERSLHKIKESIILFDCHRSVELSQQNSFQNRETLIVPFEEDFFLLEQIITHDSFMKINHNRLLVTVEHDESIIAAQKYLFDFVWKQGKEIGRYFGN